MRASVFLATVVLLGGSVTSALQAVYWGLVTIERRFIGGTQEMHRELTYREVRDKALLESLVMSACLLSLEVMRLFLGEYA
ncbi:MAG: hypothetical protein AAB463_01045 [Patescibacteria group bacterium]